MKTLSILIVFLTTGALFAAYPDEYPAYLRLLGFRKDQIRELSEGRFIVQRLKDTRPGENGITAAKVFNIPGYFIRDYYSYVENFRNLRNFEAVGKFKTEPGLIDLAPLRFEPAELQDLASCAQNCTLNLTDEEIAGIQSHTNLEELYRNILLDRLLEYRKEGERTQTYLQDFPHLAAYFPLVIHYSTSYPATKDRRIPDLFYWVKEKLGNRNVIQIRHVFSQRINEDFVLVDQLVYSNHSLMASAFVMHLVNYADGGYPRTLLVYHGRNYVDPEAAKSTTIDRRIFSRFRVAGEELENRYQSRHYPGFPHGLAATDQR